MVGTAKTGIGNGWNSKNWNWEWLERQKLELGMVGTTKLEMWEWLEQQKLELGMVGTTKTGIGNDWNNKNWNWE